MATSTIPALKKALLAQLKARPGLSGVQIAYGAPAGMPQHDLIILDAVANHREVAGALGMQRRDERYTLNIRVISQANGTDRETQTERAFAIAAEVENQLRSDAKVNNCGVQWAVVASNTLIEPSTELQMAPEIRLRVDCMARI